MKGIVLAAGKGSRISELKLQHKSFAVVQKKRIIDYSLDLLADCAVDEIIIVVGYHAETILEAIGNSYKGIPVKYVYQKELKGVAHAVLMAKEALDDDFIMCLADEILLNPRLPEMIAYFRETGASCVCGAVMDATDFSGKPIAYEVAEDNRILKVSEKPSHYPNAIRGIGECIFKKECLEILPHLKPNPLRGGEFEMGEWIQIAADQGRAYVYDLADAYINVNYAQDIEKANELITAHTAAK